MWAWLFALMQRQPFIFVLPFGLGFGFCMGFFLGGLMALTLRRDSRVLQFDDTALENRILPVARLTIPG
jgi:hypothetical protein